MTKTTAPTSTRPPLERIQLVVALVDVVAALITLVGVIVGFPQ